MTTSGNGTAADGVAATSARAADLAAVLAGVPEPGDPDGLRKYLHALAELGCAVVFLRPRSKKPDVDLRTKAQRDADDQAAQDAAREAGLIGWELATSKAGVHLATIDTDRIDAYLDAYTKRFGASVVVNMGVTLGLSGLIVVDTDTPEQEQAFRALAGLGDDTAPTVVTPGTQDSEGRWAHHGGGHRYYTVPVDMWLPESGELKLEGGAAGVAYWGGGRQTVLPPSVRQNHWDQVQRASPPP